MLRYTALMMIVMCTAFSAMAQKVTVDVVDQPASVVFRSLIGQTGKNFVYSSDILDGIRVTLTASDRPLKKVLTDMFAGTDIEFRIKGDNVILKRKMKPSGKTGSAGRVEPHNQESILLPANARLLNEVTVESRLESPQVETAEIGAKKVTGDEVLLTPSLLGEPDVIKALHTQPGVVEGMEGLAGMYVHGGNADENLYMLDNVPLYHVNHFAGLFSAFNPDIIRYIDFYKSSMPAKYDGRLSSFMDVRLQNGRTDGHHGSARLGLTSGAFNLSGPIGRNTTYLIGVRRSWFDVLTVPMVAIVNSLQKEEYIRFHYYFMDLNAKVTHRFSDRATGFASVYFGNDFLKSGTKDASFDRPEDIVGTMEDDKYDIQWGNFVAQSGINYRFNTELSAEFTAAYTRYFSSMEHHDTFKSGDGESTYTIEDLMKTDNHIDDWILRGDFDWNHGDNSRVRFGANYIRHSFLPARTTISYIADGVTTEARDSTWAYRANEFNAYIEDDWRVNDKFRFNVGLHSSLFYIDGKVKYGLSPRLSLSYRPYDDIAVKAAYSRTVQYVHQLTQTYLSLPTDQWIPVTGGFKPESADKIALGGYWQSPDRTFAVSAEGYFKWMHNLLDYSDEYYLRPPLEIWNARLTQGRGSAKGVDLKVEKLTGKFTGHVSYSLAWADRTFADKNGGRTYPARFDNRHTINMLVNWDISDKVQLSASWIGHSGNRFTFHPQVWEGLHGLGEAPLRVELNNYRLPFYHRLDLSCTVRNKRGYWTFGFYNAYNHMNVVAVQRGYENVYESIPDGGFHIYQVPVFRKVKLLPAIPSISYTWKF